MATLSDEAAYKKRADELGSVWAQGETKSAGCKRDSRWLGHKVGKYIFDYLFFLFSEQIEETFNCRGVKIQSQIHKGSEIICG